MDINRKRAWSQNQEYGQLGIIESVSLRNFMCHDNLKFDFDPHMNFIIGRNGSGKSAVLTGVILALGGKSGATGRYTNIKGFIKTGKHSASVSVTLKNCGPEAYKPNEFGMRITVERNFNAEGLSSYKLKSQSGQILSTSKEELTNILNVMDIQIENPITVLTQEISRNFLVSKNSKGHKLFQLFYRGTGLAKIEDDYNKSLQSTEEGEKETAFKKAALPEMEKEIKTLKMLLESSSKIMDLKNELLWAVVIEREKTRDEAIAELEAVKRKENILQQKENDFTNEYRDICQLVTQVEAERRSSNEKMEKLRQALLEETNKRTPLAHEIRELKGTLTRYEREVKRLSSEISSLENMTNEIKLKNESDVNEDKIKHQNAIAQLNEVISKITDQARDMEAEKNACLQRHTDLQTKLEHCHAEIQEHEYKQKILSREKTQLIDGMQNKLNVYGPEIRQVLQDINSGMKAGLFKVEPKGPIGVYIKVKNQDWSLVVQECLKLATLRAFCCDNHSDADQLAKILNKHYSSVKSRPSIITSKFVNKVYDVQNYKAQSDHPTVFDMLEIKDPVITNCLIDQKKIENILLIKNENEAINLMMYKPPKYCNSAYTITGDQLYHSPYRNYAYRNKNQICFLKTMKDEDIREKDKELNSITALIKEKHAKRDYIVQCIEKASEKMKLISSQSVKSRTKLKELHMKLKDEETTYEEPKDINCLHGDLDQLQLERTNLCSEINAGNATLNSKNMELDELDKVIEKLKNLLRLEEENLRSLSVKVTDYESKQEALLSGKRKIEMQIRDLQPSIETAISRQDDAIATLQCFISNAESTGPRIETNRSSETIREILKETERTIKEKRNCDQATLASTYKEKVERLNKAKLEIENLERINTRLRKMLNWRFDKFQKICKNNIVSLTCCFTTLLRENDFSGYPDVNLEAQTLEIYAKPEKMHSKSTEKQNLAQLSGGERSYVTIAFLLALWDRIHMPFRILDEYDVFMDQNNRHLSINLLINAAKGNKNIQYIFLSPLELPPMEDTSDVKVHKMPAPKR